MGNEKHGANDVKKVCESKLSISFRSGKEYNGWFEHGGKRIARITIPHGRNPLPKGTYKSMASQLKLTVEEFDKLLACPLTLRDYLKILCDSKVIDDNI